MIYDICAVVKSSENKEEKGYQYLANASSASHLNLLLDKYLPEGAEIINISVNPSIDKVHVINAKGNKVIKVLTSPEDDCEYINEVYEDSEYPEYNETYCIANSINEVLSKISELEYEGELIEISTFTENISYIH